LYRICSQSDYVGEWTKSQRCNNSASPHAALKIIGTGNACPTDMESFGSLEPSLFKGRAMAIIRSGKQAGKIIFIVQGTDLSSAEVQIDVE
jgi:beta-galactosidase